MSWLVAGFSLICDAVLIATAIYLVVAHRRLRRDIRRQVDGVVSRVEETAQALERTIKGRDDKDDLH